MTIDVVYTFLVSVLIVGPGTLLLLSWFRVSQDLCTFQFHHKYFGINLHFRGKVSSLLSKSWKA